MTTPNPNKTKVLSIILEVLKFIFTIGISHINKRKNRVEDTLDDAEPAAPSDSTSPSKSSKKSKKSNEK